jgi:hypothetical protein
MDTAAHPASTMPRYTATEAGVSGSMTATQAPASTQPVRYTQQNGLTFMSMYLVLIRAGSACASATCQASTAAALMLVPTS